MKVSVLIPTYNSTKVIQATLDSVLRQTVPPYEILVMDDGSTDNTVSILNSYAPRVTVFRQANRGVAYARNYLCSMARGDLIAFLDHDDIWHHNYLNVQCKLAKSHPNAIGFFTGHINFHGYGNYQWNMNPPDKHYIIDVIDPLNFLKRYNKAPAPFASMSFFCTYKEVLKKVGSEPFSVTVSGADDYYFFNLLPLLGPLVYYSIPLVAYRITNNAHSSDRLKSVGLAVNSFELLEKHYRTYPEANLLKTFRIAFSSKRRHYGKILMGANKKAEARKQMKLSLNNTNNPVSLAKSILLLFMTYMPAKLQPTWPPSQRES